ncbi:MAG: hypothetical protein PHE84_02175 [bacterium]|nr:hypothetical protein [bacterium]
MENRETKGKQERKNPAGLVRMLRRQSGFALPVALVVLLVITFLGISAITFTNLDVDVSRNVRNSEFVFYTADSCLTLARGVLSQTHNLTTGWTTTLAGHGIAADEVLATGDRDGNTGVVTGTTGTPVHVKRGAILYNLAGVEILNYSVGTQAGNGFCTVYVRNNREDLTASHTDVNADTDGIVVVTAIGTSSSGAQDTIEAAISWKALTAIPYPEIADYPQMTMGPQNLNAARANLDVL